MCPLLKEGADRLYERKLNDEDVENRNVHKSAVMEMSGFDKDGIMWLTMRRLIG